MKKNCKNYHLAFAAPERYDYTCIVPVCVIDPLMHNSLKSYDPFVGHKVVELAAINEGCMVWAPIKGTVNFDSEELLSTFFHIFDNIGQKGFTRIIVYYCGDVCIHFGSFPSYQRLCLGKTYNLHHVIAPLNQADSSQSAVNDNIDSDQEKFELEAEVNRLSDIIRIVKNSFDEN